MPFLERLGASNRSRNSMADIDPNDFDHTGSPFASEGPQHAKGAGMCGVEGCTSGWLKPWKSHTRPYFEESWGCSGRCLRVMVAAAVRREVSDGWEPASTEPHRHRVPLGLVLMAQGWVTHPQLQNALAAQRASGRGRIGEWLTQHCGLPEERIARGLGVQWNCPVLTLDGFSPEAMALTIPKRFVAEFGIVPLRTAGSSLLYVAFQEQMKPALTLGLEMMSGLRVESGLLPGSHFDTARERLLKAQSVPVRLGVIADADALAGAVARLIESRQPVASRLIRVHQYVWLRMWLESGTKSRDGQLPLAAADMEDHLFTLRGPARQQA